MFSNKKIHLFQFSWRQILGIVFALISGLTMAADEFVLMANPPASASYRVYSLDDNNQLDLSGLTYQVNKGGYVDVVATSLVAGDILKSARPVSIGTDKPAANYWVNKRQAGTQFAIPHYRYAHTLYIHAVSQTAQVAIDTQGVIQNIVVPAGTSVTFDAGTGNGFATLLQSDEPVLVLHKGDNAGTDADVFAVSPTDLSLWGIRSVDVIVAATEDVTSVTATASDGTSETFQINAGATQLITVGSSLDQGQGSALVITADKPISALQIDDGDGQSSIPFASQASLASRHIIPSDTQYLVSICPDPGSVVRLYGPGLVHQKQSCVGATGAPGAAYFGTPLSGVQVPEGSWLESEDPVFLITETVASEQEGGRQGLVNTYYLIDPDSDTVDINIIGLSNDTWVVAGSSEYLLDQGEQLLIPAGTLTQDDKIQSSDDISVAFSQGALIQPVSGRISGTSHVVPQKQGEHTYYLLSPDQDTEVEVIIDTNTTVLQLVQGQVQAYLAGSDNSVAAQFRATSPIIVGHKGTITIKIQGQNTIIPVDAFTVAPAATELWGIRTKKAYVGVMEDATSIDVWASNGATKSYSLDAGEMTELKVGQATAEGQGSALHVVADKPMAAIQFDDSDGDSISTFWPRNLLDTRFALPIATQYAAIVCPGTSTNVTVTEPGQAGVTAVCSASGDTPNVSYFGSSSDGTNLQQATTVESDQPVFVLYEPSATDAETNLVGTRSFARPRIPVFDTLPPIISSLPYDISGTTDPDVQIQLFIAGTTAESAISDATGVFVISTQSLLEGGNQVHAVASLLGSESAPSDVEMLTYTPPPDAPVLDAVASPVRSDNISITGLATPNIEVRVFSNTVLSQTVTADGMGAFQANPVLQAGDNTIYATAWDASQESVASNSLLINYLPPPPPPVINQPSSPVAVDTINITGTALAGDEVRLFVGGLQQSSVTADGLGQFTAQVSLISGINQIYATDWDGGAESIPSNAVNVDYQPPVPPSPPTLDSTSSPTAVSPITITGTAQVGMAEVRFYLEGVLHITVVPDGAGLFSAQVSLVSGMNTIHATAWDGSLESSASNTLNVDYQPPLPPSAPVLDSTASPTAVSPITITGTAEVGLAAMRIYLEGSLHTSVVPDGAGLFSAQVSLISGINTIHATAWDGSLESGASNSLIVDYQPVLQPSTPVLDPAISPTSDNPYLVTGNADPAMSIDIFVGGKLEATVTSNGSGDFSATLPLLDGLNSVFAIADNGQLTSDPSATIEITYVNIVPRLQNGTISQDTVWTKGNGDPYILDANLTIAAGANLIIQQGVTVLANVGQTISIFVNGTLDVRGVLGDMAVISANSATPAAGNWAGIQVNAGGNLIMDYGVVEYASTGIYYTLDSIGTINNSNISNNFDGLSFRERSVGVVSSSIISNNRYGVRVDGDNITLNNPQVTINTSSLYSNAFLNYTAIEFGDPANTILDARNNWWGSTDVTVIENSIHHRQDNTGNLPWVDFTGYLDGGGGNPVSSSPSLIGSFSADTTISVGSYDILSLVTIDAGVTVTIEAGTTIQTGNASYGWQVNGTLVIQGTNGSSVVMTSSKATPAAGNWAGIQVNAGGNLIMDYGVVEYASTGIYYTLDSIGTINNSNISNNFDGLSFRERSVGVVSSSIISNNRYGVRVDGDNITLNNPQVTINTSSLYSNAFLNYTAIEFGDPANTILDARNNWWGSTDVTVIENSIHHRQDNTGNLPWVDFTGYLDGGGGNPVSSSPSLIGSFSADTTISVGSYDILSLVTIDAGVTVTIEAGTTIQTGNASYGWQVNGTLVIQGTNGSSVVMTSSKATPAAGNWAGIQVNAGGNLIMDYGVVEYASTGIYFTPDSIGTINNSIISNNFNGLSFKERSVGTVTGSVISNNRYGVQVDGDFVTANNPQVTINTSSLYSNVWGNYVTLEFGDAENTILDARNNWWGSTDVTVIENSIYHRQDNTSNRPWVDFTGYLDGAGGNPVSSSPSLFGSFSIDTTISAGPYDILSRVTIDAGVTVTIEAGTTIQTGNASYGWDIDGTLVIQGTNGSSVVMTSSKATPAAGNWAGIQVNAGGNLIMDYGVVEYASTGIYFTPDSIGTINNSIISNNFNGLSFKERSVGTVTGSVISNNRYGVQVDGDFVTANNPQVTINTSSLYSNVWGNYVTLEFGDAENTILDARNNWWGSTDVTVIENSIYHRQDNTSNRPWVDFTGYLDGAGGNPVSSSPSLFGSFSIDTTISAGPYDILSRVTIDAGVTVTIEAGTTIQTGNASYGWDIDGTLVIQGTNGNSVVMTSSKAAPAAGNWAGIQVNAGGNLIMDYGVVEYANTGISFTPDSIGTINNSIISNNFNGLSFKERSVGTVTGSVISNNRYGVWVDGDNITLNNPQVTINTSSLYSNNFYNYWAIEFGDPANTILDARNNWWGSPDVTVIENSIHHRQDNTGNRPWVDYLQFLDSEGGSIQFAVFGQSITAGTANSTQGLVANLTFNTNSATTSRVRVYETDGTILLKEYTHIHTQGESVNYQWDGRDELGSTVPDGIYRMELYVTDGTNEYTWDPVATGTGSNSGTIPGSYNIYKNEFLKLNLTLPQAGLVTMEVTPSGETVFNAIYQQPFGAGTHLVDWDGRRPDGSIITGSSAIWFVVPANTRANAVVVNGGTPQITGTGLSPNIEVKSDPYLITHSYEQTSTISFRVDQDSNVTFKLLPPGIYDPNDASAITMINNELRFAEDGGGNPLDHAVQWLGHDGTDTNEILVTDEGVFTFTIEATSVASGQTALYRGVLQIRQ